jgi:hypothetical protein
VVLSTVLDAIVQTTKPIGQRLFVAADTEFVAHALTHFVPGWFKSSI